MCNVQTIGLGIQGAYSMNKTITAMLEDKQYNDYQEYKNQAVWDDYIRESRALNNSYSQEQLSNAVQRQQSYLQNIQQRATAQAHGSSAGLTGYSIDNLYRGYDRAAAYNNYLSQRNLQMKGLQYNDRLLNNLQYPTLNSLYGNKYGYRYQNNTLKAASEMVPSFVNSVKRIYSNKDKNQNL